MNMIIQKADLVKPLSKYIFPPLILQTSFGVGYGCVLVIVTQSHLWNAWLSITTSLYNLFLGFG